MEPTPGTEPIESMLEPELVLPEQLAAPRLDSLASGERALRVPVPYALGSANAGLARLVSRALFGRKGRLPSILTPRKFEARFKPLRFPNGRAREALGWSPPVPFDEGLRRTFARPGASPDADGPPRIRPEPKAHARATPEGASTP